MDAAQALADLVEISSQIDAAVLLSADGKVEAATVAETGRAEELGRLAREIGAAAVELDGRDATQIEVALLEGSVFVVRSEGRTILATTRPDPTVGLVLYDLRSCLRNAAGSKPPAKRRRSTKTKTEGDGAAA